jgi:hypothetical protein
MNFSSFLRLFAGKYAEAIKTKLLSVLNFAAFSEFSLHFCTTKYPEAYVSTLLLKVNEFTMKNDEKRMIFSVS